jgi:DHA1 family bicyclomycin/chloramphenicol resistance-like MFS transporter
MTSAGLGLGQTAALLGLVSTVGPLAIDMYLPAFPAMAADLHATPAEVQLSLVAFFCAMAVGQLVYGPLSDAFGRKRPLQVGLALFLVTSIGCVLAPDIRTLILLRALQGLGACSGMTIARAVVRDQHTGPQAAKLLSLMILVWGVSPLFAPLAGSLILQIGGWRLIFGILTGLVGLTLLLVTFVLPESHPAHRRTEPSAAAMVQTYLRLLRDRRLMGLTFSNASWSGSVFAYLATSSFVFAHEYRLSPLGYGMMFGVCASGMVASSQANSWLMRRLGAERQLRWVGLFAMVAAVFLTGMVLAHLAPLPVMMLGSFLLFASQGVSMTPASVTALDHQGANAGAAAALMGAVQLATGSAISGVVSALFAPQALVLVGTQLACMLFGAVAVRVAFWRGARS